MKLLSSAAVFSMALAFFSPLLSCVSLAEKGNITTRSTAQGSALQQPVLIPSRTEFVLVLDAEVSSKEVHEGDSITAILRDAFVINGRQAIAPGAVASGFVAERSGKGAFGKSAKLTIEFTSISLGGRSLPVTGRFRREGSGRTAATVGAAVAAGVFAAFVTGKSAVFTKGETFKVYSTESFELTAP